MDLESAEAMLSPQGAGSLLCDGKGVGPGACAEVCKGKGFWEDHTPLCSLSVWCVTPRDRVWGQLRSQEEGPRERQA